MRERANLIIQVLRKQQECVNGDLCAASLAPFYNAIKKSAVTNSLVTLSLFSSLRLPHPALLLQLGFNKPMENIWETL